MAQRLRTGDAGLRRRAAAAARAERLPNVPPATKQPPASGGRPSEIGEPSQRLILGVDRSGAFEPRSAVDRERADDQVEQHRQFGGRARDKREVAGEVDRTSSWARARRGRCAAPRAPPRPSVGDRRAGVGGQLGHGARVSSGIGSSRRAPACETRRSRCAIAPDRSRNASYPCNRTSAFIPATSASETCVEVVFDAARQTAPGVERR